MSPLNDFLLNSTPSSEIYSLSLHDALPIFDLDGELVESRPILDQLKRYEDSNRSEEHTSELQSPYDFVCRLLLEKKKRSSPPTRPKRYAPTSRCKLRISIPPRMLDVDDLHA